ncbi:MAG: efflux RND transporter periplasmic adaptor subunit [Candidatus Paceibacterota bacterium]
MKKNNKNQEKPKVPPTGIKSRIKKVGNGIKKRKKWAIITTIFVGIIAIIALITKPKPPEMALFEARKTDLAQEISLTGKVKAAESVILSFERAGRVSFVLKNAGDKVYAGNLIASLDNSSLEADLMQAEASVRSAEAELANILSGTRPEEINVQEARVLSARQSFEIAEKELSDKLDDNYGKADELVRNKIDRFFSAPKSVSPQLVFNVNDYFLENEIESNKKELEDKLSAWVSAGDISAKASAAVSAFDALRIICDNLLIAFGGDITSIYSQSTIDGWETDTISVRSSASTAGSTITTAKEKYLSALNNLAIEEEQLNLKKSGPTAYQIESYSAKVESAKAAVDSIKAGIRKGMIISPISGVIGSTDITAGEIISAGVPAATVISDKKFQIKANIPEVDIAKIKAGNRANLTLDAYGNDVVFEAEVISIDPGETIIEGITTYETTLEFIEDDERIKSGMTANIDVLGGERTDVLAVPQRAVITENGRKFLNILKEGNVVKVEVKVGFKASDGYIEITEGLNEGDQVITSTSL